MLAAYWPFVVFNKWNLRHICTFSFPKQCSNMLKLWWQIIHEFYCNLVPFSAHVAVEEFWKSVEIWRSYCREFGGTLLETRCGWIQGDGKSADVVCIEMTLCGWIQSLFALSAVRWWSIINGFGHIYEVISAERTASAVATWVAWAVAESLSEWKIRLVTLHHRREDEKASWVRRRSIISLIDPRRYSDVAASNCRRRPRRVMHKVIPWCTCQSAAVIRSLTRYL